MASLDQHVRDCLEFLGDGLDAAWCPGGFRGDQVVSVLLGCGGGYFLGGPAGAIWGVTQGDTGDEAEECSFAGLRWRVRAVFAFESLVRLRGRS